MGLILFLSIVLYSLFLAYYFGREWWNERRRRNQKARTAPPPKEDIMGKGGTVRSHSTPNTATLIQSEKRDENDSTFAPGNREIPVPRPPAAIPNERLDEVFSSDPEDAPMEVDLAFDDTPDPYYGVVDRDERDDEREKGEITSVRLMATGVGFDELSRMTRTVDAPNVATISEKLDAGRVLFEVRQTDMFEAIVSGRPEKRVTAGQLMDDFRAEWRRRKRGAADGTTEEPFEKAPDDFDPRKAFA